MSSKMQRYGRLMERLRRWRGICAPALPLAVMLLAAAIPHAQAADPNALWKIVSTKCVPERKAGEEPKPCAQVDLHQGVALLKDLVGVAQYLAIATRRIPGMEDPVLLQDGATMAVGWQARSLVEAKLGHPLPRDAVSLAVNSAGGRSQSQLHVHIDCLNAEVRQALQGTTVGEGWAPLPVKLMNGTYIARRLPGAALHANPYRLLAEKVQGPLTWWSLAVVGATMPDGRPGFLLLATEGPHAAAEELQDHTCHGY